MESCGDVRESSLSTNRGGGAIAVPHPKHVHGVGRLMGVAAGLGIAVAFSPWLGAFN